MAKELISCISRHLFLPNSGLPSRQLAWLLSSGAVLLIQRHGVAPPLTLYEPNQKNSEAPAGVADMAE